MTANPIIGNQSALGQTGSVVIKTGSGRVKKVIVNTAAASMTLSDVATVGGVAAANLIFAIPNVVGIYDVDFPFFNGLTLVGSTGVLAISFD